MHLLLVGYLRLKNSGHQQQGGEVNVDREPWVGFQRAGVLTVCPGAYLDLSEIEWKAVEYSYKYGTIWTADPHMATQMLQNLKREHGIPTTVFPQTYKHYNEPTKELLRLIGREEIMHDGDPLLSWALGHLIVHRNTRGERIPDKEKSMEKIDPAVALIMALGYALATEFSEGQRGAHSPAKS